MPNKWQVHHVGQQAEAIAARFSRELGIDVHDLANLRGVPQEIHTEISGLQRKFWNAKIQEYGSREAAYAKTPMSDIQQLNKAIEEVYGSFMVRARATAADIAAVEARLVDKRVLTVGRASRVKTVLTKVNIALGVLAIFGVVISNAALAANIAAPPVSVQLALDDFLDMYGGRLFRGPRQGNN